MEVPVFEATNRLSALLNEVERGGEALITRRGLAVTKLVPAGPSSNRELVRRAAEGLRAVSQGVRLDGIRIKELIDESRS